MSEQNRAPFLDFLAAGLAKGGFETDDALAALLPLMRQVLATHEAGFVAPLDGVQDLLVTEAGHLQFAPERVRPPVKRGRKVDALQAAVSHAVEVVAEARRVTDINQASVTVSDLGVGTGDGAIAKPVFLAGYRSWEQAIGHHDELTDLFSLGMLLASVACGLDFTETGDLEIFSVRRTNLFELNPRLNPVVASVIVQMTELNRHRRAPDLGQMISRLEHYREQVSELNLTSLGGFKEAGLTGKRRLIQAHLRDRLFEISRRNRLIYFKPTLQTLNLTVGSVPLVLDYRNIRLEQLFVWHDDLAATVTAGAPMSLGKYLRFEDAPYLPGVLDKIISEARRDRAEYGFAQLRLVLCFLHWHNLKETPDERIHSPLLLLPVELTKKKGVRDNYILDPATSEAEVNPALRHHLKELYGLELPELVDLKETPLDRFFENLKGQIQASEPGVTLNLISRPQIELIHEKARQRVDQYQRRLKLQARRTGRSAKPAYSYERENLQPLGLQLFLEKVRPTPLPLRDAVGGAPQPRLPHIVDPAEPEDLGPVLETERRMFALRERDSQNPYSWDFDLCSLTLGNFNYRKMTLVSDFAKLIETDMASDAFDAVFSLAPKPAEPTPPPPLALADQHLVIPCDAAQASAIARARTGASYIIQGPPGTGKSQTITNLIADYVARGQRVLFVCEKRAAIDVVFHRLRQQGLDELCCLIHDSQTDKKAFIQNLKQTYEQFLGTADPDPEAARLRASTLRAMEQELAILQKFSETMREANAHTGIAVRSLLHRLVALPAPDLALPPEAEEVLPEYPLWLLHGEVVGRLHSALAESGEELCFAKHPLRWLGHGVLQADRPVEALHALLDEAEGSLDAMENALELSGLPDELWDTFAEIRALVEFAVRVRPLAERQLLDLLASSPATAAFQELGAELDAASQRLAQAKRKTAGWREPLSPDDTQSALAQARTFESSVWRFLQPAFWRLRRTLQERYDFSQHAVPPTWSKLLGDLAACHEAEAAMHASEARARQEWRCEDVPAFRALVGELRSDPLLAHPSVNALLSQLVVSNEAGALIESLAGVQEQLARLDETLRFLLAEHEQFDFAELTRVLAALRGLSGLLAELTPLLGELAGLPAEFSHALRRVEVPLDEFEGAVGRKSLNQLYRQDRAFNRFEGRLLTRKMEQLEKRHTEWLALNARCLRAAVRRKLVEHVNVSSLPASQLSPDQKAFKKAYAAGRRDLEHEFGKTMRFKSIRDLAAGDTGRVIQDLKPIWLMSPLSVSDTLPLDPELFDVVIFDEASQIPLEEAIPAIYRSHQVIVVGDQMQLPPTTFFAAARTEDESVIVEDGGERVEVDLDSDSFLTQSAQNLPSTLLAWHYRSRYESLISFSNAAFYAGELYTIPDRQRALANRGELLVNHCAQGASNVGALLARSISFHYLENGVYEERCNPNEAAYIAHLVCGLLQRQTNLSIGIVAFSEAQQTEIEGALTRLAAEDDAFAETLESEYVREENDMFCGLFVKNLENVQGDERDLIVMSVCYGPDAHGRMLMNFGPINQRGGEKRLNVIFSRAKHHMAVISSIRHQAITNDFNDGANSLKRFLEYAEAVSKGDTAGARRVLESLHPLSRQALAPPSSGDAVVAQLAEALRARGYAVELQVGQSRFRCDLAVRNPADELHQLGILVDTDAHYANPNLLDRYLTQPAILRAFGWRFALVLTKDWYHNPDDVLGRLEKLLQGRPPVEEPEPSSEAAVEPETPAAPPPSTAATPAVVSLESAPAAARRPETARSPSGSPPAVVPGQVRHFELISDTSRKFWEIAVTGSSCTVRFGRIGTTGQSQSKSFADEATARLEANRLVAEKLKKGYLERTGS